MHKIKYMVKYNIIVAILVNILFFASCSRNSDVLAEEFSQITPSEEAKVIINLDATSQVEWVYFSFSKGEIVNISDPKNDLSWDIAFNRYNIRTNSGVSGLGKGGVFRLDEKNFDNVSQVPTDLTYEIDIEDSIAVRNGVQKIERNKLISGDIGSETGWWSYQMPVGGATTPTTTINQWIYIVKDANGTPVKIQLTDYYHTQSGTSGFISFQYQKAKNNTQF